MMKMVFGEEMVACGGSLAVAELVLQRWLGFEAIQQRCIRLTGGLGLLFLSRLQTSN